MTTRRYLSSIEILEDRIAPAGIVTVVAGAPGEFTLTGDGADNQISIFQTESGKFRIEGLTGTTLNPGGVTSIDTNTLTRLTLIGNDGNDTFTLGNLKTLTSLVVDGGTGADTLNSVNLAVTGKVDISGGAGLDSFNFDGLTTNITGKLTI